MIKQSKFLLFLSSLCLTACGLITIEPDTSRWHRHCSAVVDKYLVCYSLPANEFVHIDYLHKTNKELEYRNLFRVIYDYNSTEVYAGDFRVYMGVTSFSETGNLKKDIDILSFEQFIDRIVKDYNQKLVSNAYESISSKEFRVLHIGKFSFLERESKREICYYLLFDNNYFLEITAQFENYSFDSEIRSDRIDLLQQIVGSLRITDHSGNPLKTISFK